LLSKQSAYINDDQGHCIDKPDETGVPGIYQTLSANVAEHLGQHAKALV